MGGRESGRKVHSEGLWVSDAIGMEGQFAAFWWGRGRGGATEPATATTLLLRMSMRPAQLDQKTVPTSDPGEMLTLNMLRLMGVSRSR